MDQFLQWGDFTRLGRRGYSRLLLRILVLVSIFGVGLWLRTLSPSKLALRPVGWWPRTTTVATLYFADGRLLFPVSRRISGSADLPRATVEALIAGPRTGSGLSNPIPPDTAIRSFRLVGGAAQVDLSSPTLAEHDDTHIVETAIVETLTALPGVTAVTLSLNGKPLVESAQREPVLYYASANGLVAILVSAANPREALTMYLSGPSDPQLTGFPPDVRLLRYYYQSADGLLSLEFSYTPSLHALAMDQPERMRTALLGLIAALTEFPQVRAVRLDFEGHTRLGLGQCSDLLGTPQPHPELLNDERLLGR